MSNSDVSAAVQFADVPAVRDRIARLKLATPDPDALARGIVAAVAARLATFNAFQAAQAELSRCDVFGAAPDESSYRQLKELGGQAFRNALFDHGAELYTNALAFLDESSAGGGRKASVLYCNRAVCHLRGEPPRISEALVDCDEALRCNAANHRAHYRKAIALLQLGKLAEAKEAASQAIALGAAKATDAKALYESIALRQKSPDDSEAHANGATSLLPARTEPGKPPLCSNASAVETRNIPEQGQGWVAVRAIGAAEVVACEEPIASLPLRRSKRKVHITGQLQHLGHHLQDVLVLCDISVDICTAKLLITKGNYGGVLQIISYPALCVPEMLLKLIGMHTWVVMFANCMCSSSGSCIAGSGSCVLALLHALDWARGTFCLSLLSSCAILLS